MMDYVLLLWLAGAVDTLQGLLIGGVLLGVSAAVATVFIGFAEGDAAPTARLWARRLLIGTLVAAGLLVALPSSRVVYAMVALRAGAEVAQTEIGQAAYAAALAELRRIAGGVAP